MRIVKIIATIFSLLIHTMGFGADQSSTTIGILPFECQTGEEYSWLSAGISDTLIAKFTGTKGIRVVERERIEKLFHHRATEELKRTQGVKQLSLLNAQYLLIGSYSIVGEQIRINARIVHAETAKINGDSTLSVKGKVADIFALETVLAEKFAKACNLEVAYNKLSYTDGKNTTSYELFNRGKTLFTEGQYTESVDSFVRAQQHNDGFYFAEAHTWEGKARIALANATDDQRSKLKVQQTHIKKFEKDAAEAAPAFYDLGVALQACGQYEKAIKAYDDYLRWMAKENKSINWKKDYNPLPIQFPSEPNGDLMFFNRYLISYALESSGVLFMYDGARLLALNPKSGREIWATPIEEASGSSNQSTYAMNTFNDKLIFCSDNYIWLLNLDDGKVLKRIKRHTPLEKPESFIENIQVSENGLSALLFSLRTVPGKSLKNITAIVIDIESGMQNIIDSDSFKLSDSHVFDSTPFMRFESRVVYGRTKDIFWYSINGTRFNVWPSPQTYVDIGSGQILESGYGAVTDQLGQLKVVLSKNQARTNTRTSLSIFDSASELANVWKTMQSEHGHLAVLGGAIHVTPPGESKAKYVFNCAGGYNKQRISISDRFIYAINSLGVVNKYDYSSGKLASRVILRDRTQFVASTDTSLILSDTTSLYSLNTSIGNPIRSSAFVSYIKGKCYKKLGEYQTAIDCFNESLITQANLWNNYYEIGECYLKLGTSIPNYKHKAFYSYMRYFDSGEPTPNEENLFNRFLEEQCGVDRRIRHAIHNNAKASPLSGVGLMNELGYYRVRENQFFSHEGRLLWERVRGRDFRANIWGDKLYAMNAIAQEGGNSLCTEVELQTGKELRKIKVMGKPITFIPDPMDKINNYIGGSRSYGEKGWSRVYMAIAGGKLITSFNEDNKTILRLTDIDGSMQIADIDLGVTGPFNWSKHSTFCYPVSESKVVLLNCRFDKKHKDQLYLIDVKNSRIVWNKDVGANLKMRVGGGVSEANYSNIETFNGCVYYFSNVDRELSIFDQKTGQLRQVIPDEKGDYMFYKIHSGNRLVVATKNYGCDCHKLSHCPNYLTATATLAEVSSQFWQNHKRGKFKPFSIMVDLSGYEKDNAIVIADAMSITWRDKGTMAQIKKGIIHSPYHVKFVIVEGCLYLRMSRKVGNPTFYKMKSFDIPDIWFEEIIVNKKTINKSDGIIGHFKEYFNL